MGIGITDHAIIQFQKRGVCANHGHALNDLSTLYKNSRPVKLKPGYRVCELLNHNFEGAEFRLADGSCIKLSGNWILVLSADGRRLMTCYPLNADNKYRFQLDEPKGKNGKRKRNHVTVHRRLQTES